jgi:membrane associated rhomboid family serine protease
MELSITIIIIIVTVLVSISGFSSPKVVDDLIFYPPAVTQQKQWWRFFTCGFIHADFGHLILNMYALYVFGRNVEKAFLEIFGKNGRIIYLAMYLLALGICLIPTYFKHRNDYQYRSLGASGAVSAVIFASIMIYPLSGMGLVLIPVYIAAFLFGILYLVMSSWLDRKGGGRINHSAHIFGSLFGVIFLIICCGLFSDYPLLQNFVSQIESISAKNIIQFGGY